MFVKTFICKIFEPQSRSPPHSPRNNQSFNPHLGEEEKRSECRPPRSLFRKTIALTSVCTT